MLLKIENLRVQFDTPDGLVRAVNGLSFKLPHSQTLGIVGESGSGKTQSMMAMLGLMPANASVSGKAIFDGQDLLALEERALNTIRGSRIAIVFQDPMTALNPYLSIGAQMTEVLRLHRGASRADARSKCVDMLRAVHIPDPGERFSSYPHQLSGGMRQRVLIAMALLCEPDLLIADEPTTALDVTVQAQILSLLRELQQRFEMAMILITHDLGVVAGNCDEVLVMYGGQCMEYAGTSQLFAAPRHPYTRGLLASLPSIDSKNTRLATIAGSPPDLRNLPKGCPFVTRCEHKLAVCADIRPRLVRAGSDQFSACHLESAQ